MSKVESIILFRFVHLSEFWNVCISVEWFLWIVNISVLSCNVLGFQDFFRIPSSAIPVGSICWKSATQSWGFAIFQVFISFSVSWIDLGFWVYKSLSGCSFPLVWLWNKEKCTCHEGWAFNHELRPYLLVDPTFDWSIWCYLATLKPLVDKPLRVLP